MTENTSTGYEPNPVPSVVFGQPTLIMSAMGFTLEGAMTILWCLYVAGVISESTLAELCHSKN